MTPVNDRAQRRRRVVGVLLVCVAGCALPFWVGAQGGSASAPLTKAAKPAADDPPADPPADPDKVDA